MAQANVTFRDIAQAAGVSLGTVSRALKSQQGMSEETRLRVLTVARKLGYDLGNLRLSRVRRVLFLLHRFHKNAQSNWFYSPVMHGAEDACSEAGIALSFSSVGPDQNVAELVRIHDPDAIICAGYCEPDVVQSIIRCGLPTILVDHHAPQVTCINDDNFNGAYTAVKHLLSQGYKRVAFISGPVAHYSIRQRERGYRKALFDAGVLADPDYVVAYSEGLDPIEASTECIDKLLALDVRPDAIFAFNDVTALVAIKHCQKAGLRIPEDVGICGYDDVESASTSHPALTTIGVDKAKLGREAVLRLLEGSEEPGDIVHPVQLIIRESCSGPSST